MAKGGVISFLLVGTSLLAFFGFKKYRQVQSLRELSIDPGKPVVQLVKVSGGMVDALINIVIKNPTEYEVQVKNIETKIFVFVNNVQVQLAIIKTNAFADAHNDSSLSVPVQFSLSKLLELTKQFFLSDAAPVFIDGSAYYVINGIAVPVPFNFSIDLKEQFKQFIAQ